MEEITNRFGEKLETVIRKPAGAGKFPTVILVAGIGADLHETKNSHDEIAHNLSEAGFVTVQFSFAGTGKSEGNYENMTLSRQARQIEDVLRWTQMQDFANSNRIGLYAMSFGVACTLAANLKHIKSLCLVSGAYHPYESLQQLFSRGGEVHIDSITWRKFSNGNMIRLKSGFWQDLKTHDSDHTLRSLKTPTIIIHGKMDNKITATEAETAYGQLGNIQKKLFIVENGDHGIIDVSRETRNDFLESVAKWFKQTV